MIVPLDFTLVSKNAMNYAIILAKKLDFQIVFVHSYNVRNSPSTGSGLATIVHPKLIYKMSIKKLNKRKLDDFLADFRHLPK